MSEEYNVEYCSVNDGIELAIFKVKRWIHNALYYACKACEASLRLIGKTVTLFLPSGTRLEIFDSNLSLTPNFKMDPIKHWAFSIKFGEVSLVSYRELPKSFSRWWEALVAPIDRGIAGSQHWMRFEDENGDWLRGSSFDPVRQYKILGHGLIDGAHIALIGCIIYALKKSGLLVLAATFAKGIFSGYFGVKRVLWQRELESDVDEIYDDMNEVQEILDINSIDDEFARLNSKIGVRVKLG